MVNLKTTNVNSFFCRSSNGKCVGVLFHAKCLFILFCLSCVFICFVQSVCKWLLFHVYTFWQWFWCIWTVFLFLCLVLFFFKLSKAYQSIHVESGFRPKHSHERVIKETKIPAYVIHRQISDKENRHIQTKTLNYIKHNMKLFENFNNRWLKTKMQESQ